MKETILDIDERARKVFTQVVENFIEHGQATGSKTLSDSIKVSPATIRNILAAIEREGFLQSPHTSAGRLPTDIGMRYFVDGILETGQLTKSERAALQEECSDDDLSIDTVFEQASVTLSGLSESAGLVIAPTHVNSTLQQVQFVLIEPQKALAVLVAKDGSVENRMINVSHGTTPAMLHEAGEFLSQRLHGKTIREMQTAILNEIEENRSAIGELTAQLIEAGLITPLGDGKMIVHGRGQLIEKPQETKNLDQIRSLMEQLESKETVSKLLEEAFDANGVKIYIGSENSIFEGSGQSLILSPYRNGNDDIVGAIGVIGPTRINYGKIIPSVNCMAEILSHRIRAFS